MSDSEQMKISSSAVPARDIQECKSCGGKIHDGTTEHVVCPVCQQPMAGVPAKSPDLVLQESLSGAQSEGANTVPVVSGDLSEVPVLAPELQMISEQELEDFERAE